MQSDLATPSRIAGAASWTIASRMVAVLGQIGLFLLVARAVGPANMGVFALASAVAMGLGMMAAEGWRQYGAVHVAERDRLAVLHGTAALSGLLATAIALAVAGIAAASGAGAFATFLAALSIGALPQAMSFAFSGRLIGSGRIAASCRASIVADLAGLALGLAVLGLGGGVWAMVVHRLATLVVGLALSTWLLSGRDAFPFALPDRHVLAHKGTFVLTAGTGWVSQNMALLAIGAALGPAAVGVFRAGARLAAALGELASEASSRLALARFGRLDTPDDGPNAGSCFAAVTFAFTAPAFVGLALVAEPLVALALGEAWAGAAPVLAALAVGRLIGLQVPGLNVVLTRLRRFRTLLALQVVPLGTAVVASLAAFQIGLAGVIGAMVLGSVVGLAVRIGLARSMSHFSLTAMGRMSFRPALATATMAIAVASLDHPDPAISLAMKVVTGAALWSVAMAALHPRMARRLAAAAIRRVRFAFASADARSSPEGTA